MPPQVTPVVLLDNDAQAIVSRDQQRIVFSLWLNNAHAGTRITPKEARRIAAALTQAADAVEAEAATAKQPIPA